jgi:F-type H+-transporting ATPase subunit epsilon
MTTAGMTLKVLLPFHVFAQHTGLSAIVANTREGSFGLLPHRRDCAAALSSGILTLTSPTEGTSYVAIDEGVLVKTGSDVLISVRRALAGTNLDQLHQAVAQQFLKVDEREQQLRSVITKLETGLMRRLATFEHD